MRDVIQNLPGSKIREVANAGLGRTDVLDFWFGESDEVTPEPIRQAAADSLLRGETFYVHNLGLPELRQAVAANIADLRPGQGEHVGLWRLDLDELLAQITHRTRLLVVNAPNNPTGWTLSRAEQQTLLEHCRRKGTWIWADIRVCRDRLVADHGLGLAPEAAFGAEGEGWLRWCYASQDPQRLKAAIGL